MNKAVEEIINSDATDAFFCYDLGMWDHKTSHRRSSWKRWPSGMPKRKFRRSEFNRPIRVSMKIPKLELWIGTADGWIYHSELKP